MNKKFLVILVVLALTTDLSVGAANVLTKRGIQDYDPVVHISSAILTFKQNDGNLNDETDTDGKLLQGEWSRFEVEGDKHQNFDAERNGYLKFVGVVGSGNIYVPEDETENHFGNFNDGLLGLGDSQWSYA